MAWVGSRGGYHTSLNIRIKAVSRRFSEVVLRPTVCRTGIGQVGTPHGPQDLSAL
jgi:hypothetical protein